LEPEFRWQLLSQAWQSALHEQDVVLSIGFSDDRRVTQSGTILTE
jgi:hypothetical protein